MTFATNEHVAALIASALEGESRRYQGMLEDLSKSCQISLNAKDDEIGSLKNRLALMQTQIETNATTAANAASAAVGGMKRPVRYFDPFFNDPAKKGESWILFRKDFKLHCKSQLMNDEQSRRALVLSVKGDAAMAVHDLDPDSYTDLETMLEAYEAKFMPAASSALAQTIFEQSVMRAGETVLNWHSRLYALWRRAYPQSTDQTPLLRRFALGINKIETRRELIRRQPTTYSLALEIAQIEEAVDKATRSTVMNQAIMPATTVDEPMDINVIGNGRCFGCNQFGHLKKDCPKKTVESVARRTSSGSRKEYSSKKGGNYKKDRRSRRYMKRMLNMMDAINAPLSDDSDSEDDEDGEDEAEDEGGDPHRKTPTGEQSADF
jgi:hypothetical protein